ncbi:MAG: hypothetical protein ACRD88_00355 [Terriglobia bacterium]
MADTTFLKGDVERYVRDQLGVEFGIPFRPRVLRLETGGTHEFDAVSEGGRVVAAIKAASGLTSGRKNPSGKIKTAIAELYFLSLVEAPVRLLVLTNPEFHTIFSREIQGRLAKGLAIKLLPLPVEMEKRVREVQDMASKEVSGPSRKP